MSEAFQMANLTISQAAERMNVSVSTIKRRVKAGMPYVKEPGGRMKFSIKDIVDWQQQYRHVQVDEPDMMTPERILKIVRGAR